jgi:hypothetical protein
MEGFINIIFFMKDGNIEKYKNCTRKMTFGKISIFETENYSKEELQTFFDIFSYFDFGCGEKHIYINDEDDIKKFSIALIVLQKIGHNIKMISKKDEKKKYISCKFELNSENQIIQPIIFLSDLHYKLSELNTSLSDGCGSKYKNIQQLKQLIESHMNEIDTTQLKLYKKYVEQIENVYKH